MKKDVKFFVSYARKNGRLVRQFLDELGDQLGASKARRYRMWRDTEIIVGEDWAKQICDARDSCDVGLLLVSPAFLASSFITEHELPSFVGDHAKSAIPVLMQPVDFNLHDLKGLERKQIFRLDYEGFRKPRAYGECRGPRRQTFVLELFREIERKLVACH